MIVIDSIDDVTALLRPLLETGSVRLVGPTGEVDIPEARKAGTLPAPAHDLIAAMLAQGTSLVVVPQDDGSLPPFTIAPRSRPPA